MKRLLLVAVNLFLVMGLGAELISIGSGTVLNQGLPIEPAAPYSYSQQLFLASEIGVGGSIDAIHFQYNVASQLFFPGNRQLTIYLGHSQRTLMSGWVPADSLSTVFSGMLSEGDFTSGLPGSGWLQISLATPFLYDGIRNLVLAVDENGSDYGNTADDFFCSNTNAQRAIQFQNMNINPDPFSPPTTGFTLKTHRSNLRLSMQPQHYYPVQPSPADAASNVSIYTDLSWLSICDTYSLSLGTRPDSLALLADNIPGAMWQLENPLQYNRQYFWQVVGYHDSEAYPSPIWSFQTTGEAISPPQNLSGYFNGQAVQLSWQAPQTGIAGSYKVYRNTALLTTTTQCAYSDVNVMAGFTYYYHVTAINSSATESGVSNLISVTIPNTQPDLVINQGFEACAAFSSIIPNWQTLDLDASSTWTWDAVTFPHEGEPYSWISFAPGETIPPLSGFSPFSGTKMLMAMSSLIPPNNDWLISPGIHLGQNASLTFQARSAMADYGLERLKVLVSTSDASPASFTALNPGNYLAVPEQWTAYTYDLSAYAGQRIHLAWNCLSVDAFALFLDDIQLTSAGAWVGVEDNYLPPPAFNSFPNPSRSSFAVGNKSGAPFSLELYDIKGRKLHTGTGLTEFNSTGLSPNLPSGIYFLRIRQGAKSWVLKQVIAK